MMRAWILAVLCLVATAAGAADTKPIVEQGWSRATAPGQTVGAGFVTLRNPATVADRLLSASSPVASRVELHTHLNENGVMKMRPVEAIDVPASGSVSLQPGGLHLMLMGLSAPLAEGQHVPLALTFEKAGRVDGELVVGGPGAKMPAMDHTQHSH